MTKRGKGSTTMGSVSGMRRIAAVLWIALMVVAWPAANATAAPVFAKLPAEMLVARYAPVIALLPNGKVLIAGGYVEIGSVGTYLKSAELFDPATGSFSPLTAELNVARSEAAFAVLPGGKVLIAGGYNSTTLKSAELFNPATSTFEKLSAEMSSARDYPAASTLSNGKVVIVGGAGEGSEYVKTPELFDPETRTFEKIPGEMTAARYAPTAGVLPNGKMLVAGGYTNASKALKTAELFSPETHVFEKLEGATHEPTEPREEAGIVALANGELLILGGYNWTSKRLKTAELFNPEAATFEKLSTEMTEGRNGPAAVLLPGGRVLIVGGYNESGKYLKSAEETSVIAPTATTTAASNLGFSTTMLAGRVLTETMGSASFQYGTTTAYGASTTSQNVAASILGLPVSAQVSGLKPSTLYHFRIVAENSGGPGYGADQSFTTAAAPPPPISPPQITGATQSHGSWREGNKLPHISRRSTPRVGTTFSFTLNEQATVTLTFTQAVKGRTVGRRCLARTNANSHRRRCTRTLTRGTLSFTGHTGANRIDFQGRIAPSTRLAPGTYTLLITATNAGAQRSSPVQLTFTIVK
jgi:hypothetical protein